MFTENLKPILYFNLMQRKPGTFGDYSFQLVICACSQNMTVLHFLIIGTAFHVNMVSINILFSTEEKQTS